MIEPLSVAVEGADVTQTFGACELAIGQGQKLALSRKFAHPRIRAVPLDGTLF